jgi:hypothetical protein
MIADRHHRDDFAGVEKQRQRAFDRHRCGDRGAGVVDAIDPHGQSRVGGVGRRM